MSRLRLLMRTLWYFRQANLAVMLAVVVGTAVLTGSLVVGDSVRASLLDIASRRLGDVDHVLHAPHFFGTTLASRLAAREEFRARFGRAEPLIWTTGSATHPRVGARAARLGVFGREGIEPGTCVLSQRLSSQLDAGPGDTVVVRMDPLHQVAAQLPVGTERTEVAIVRLKLAGVAERGGQEDAFSFYGTQRPVRSIWVALGELQATLEVTGRANVIFVSAREGHDGEEDAEALGRMLDGILRLEDHGLRLGEAARGELSLESDSILIPNPVADAAARAAPGARRVLAYVADTVRDADTGKAFPYAMVAGVAPMPGGEIRPGGLVLNRWAADEVDAEVGHRIEITYVIRAASGLLEERTAAFSLQRVVGMEGIGADRTLVPEFKGVTDATSVSTWKPPRDFSFHADRIRPADEEYWDRYRASPKAFLNLDDARRLWGAEFGTLTSIRLAGPGPEEAARGLLRELSPEDTGLVWQAIRRRLLAGAGGNTDFGELFIGFSFFLVISAALLVVLIMRLSIEQRSRQIGVMCAMGFTPSRLKELFFAEGVLVLLVGTMLGSALALGYARVMLTGLKTIWNRALGTTLLTLAAEWRTLLIGGALSLCVGAFAVWRAIARVHGMSVVEAIGKKRIGGGSGAGGGAAVPLVVAGVLFLLAAGVAAAPLAVEDLSTTIAFFASGACCLAASLAALQGWLRFISRRKAASEARVSLGALSARNAARNPGRSMLTAGLVASASFLTVAVGSMRSERPAAARPDQSAHGGYSLIAEFDVPLPYDLNNAKGRELLALGRDEQLWTRTRFACMRTSAGDDVSCRNLYRPGNPRLTSVPPAFSMERPFRFVVAEGDADNPWKLLEAESPDGAIPAVADYETARWIIHKGLGDTLAVIDEKGARRTLRLVALLKKSMFQGELLVGEGSFRRLFPGRTGYGQVLLATRPEDTARARASLAHGLADFGVHVETTAERMSTFAGIADTYISAFQALGALGLFLGSLGLLVVLARNVIERRSEISLMKALGVGRGRVAAMIAMENALLLFAGMCAGTLSAFLAVSPELARSGGQLASLGLTLAFFCCTVTGVTALLAAASAVLVGGVSPAALRQE